MRTFVFLALAATACDSAPEAIEDPVFSDIAAITEARCATSGCHDGTTDPGMAYADLVDVESPFGIPFIDGAGANPDDSYMFLKIRNRQSEVGGDGAQMPLTGGALSEVDEATIENWILDGAPQ